MRKKKQLFAAAAILFIIVNALLIGFDKEKNVNRLAYIKEWAPAEVKDLHETYETDGIVRYGDESHVYFDDHAGNLNEFLVEEGDTVEAGDPLYTYFVRSFAETQTSLEQKADALEQEITSIDTAIEKAKAYQAQSQSGSSMGAVSPYDTAAYGTSAYDQAASDHDRIEDLQEQIEDAGSEQVEALLEQYVIDQEKERDQKEAQVEGIRKQLAALTSSGDTITVESPSDGKITQVSKNLADPLITISDLENLVIAGEITEQERMQTEEDMEAVAVMQKSGEVLDAVLRHVSEEPTDVNVDSESIYPFTADLKEPEKAADLLPGYHASLEIITKTARQATAVPNRAIYHDAVWQMGGNGKVIRRKAQTGINEKGFTQINNEIEQGNWVALSPKSNFRDQAVFITPLELTKLSQKKLQADKRTNLKYVITGLLSR